MFGVRFKFISLVIIENHILTRGYATRENIAFYDHSWNKFLSYTNIQQISSIWPHIHLFQGYVKMICQMDCVVTFHQVCWKSYKNTLNKQIDKVSMLI